jgi:hypothetical protein
MALESGKKWNIRMIFGLDLAFLGVFLSGTFEWSFCGFGGVDGGLSHIVCFGRRRRI